MRKSARLAYCVLFTLAMVLAWVLRDFAKPLIDKLPCKPPIGVPLVSSASCRAAVESSFHNFHSLLLFVLF